VHGVPQAWPEEGCTRNDDADDDDRGIGVKRKSGGMDHVMNMEERERTNKGSRDYRAESREQKHTPATAYLSLKPCALASRLSLWR
jgi:PAB1-binding protein PBP1